MYRGMYKINALVYIMFKYENENNLNQRIAKKVYKNEID